MPKRKKKKVIISNSICYLTARSPDIRVLGLVLQGLKGIRATSQFLGHSLMVLRQLLQLQTSQPPLSNAQRQEELSVRLGPLLRKE